MGQGPSHDYLIRTSASTKEILVKSLDDHEFPVSQDQIYCLSGVWCWCGKYYLYELETIFELPIVTSIQRFGHNLTKPQMS